MRSGAVTSHDYPAGRDFSLEPSRLRTDLVCRVNLCSYLEHSLMQRYSATSERILFLDLLIREVVTTVSSDRSSVVLHRSLDAPAATFIEESVKKSS